MKDKLYGAQCHNARVRRRKKMCARQCGWGVPKVLSCFSCNSSEITCPGGAAAIGTPAPPPLRSHPPPPARHKENGFFSSADTGRKIRFSLLFDRPARAMGAVWRWCVCRCHASAPFSLCFSPGSMRAWSFVVACSSNRPS